MLINLNDIPKVPKRFSGQHIGIVVNNKDPKKLGAVQISIPGLIEGDPKSLPWATSIQPPGLGGSSGCQNLAVPNVGSRVTVNVIDQYTMYYTGWQPTEPLKNGTLTEDYPATYGQIDEQGNGWYVNRAQKYLKITHTSGTTVTLTADGSCIIEATNNIKLDASNDIEITAANKIKLQSNSLEINCETSTMQSNSSSDISSGGPLTLTGAPLVLNG